MGFFSRKSSDFPTDNAILPSRSPISSMTDSEGPPPIAQIFKLPPEILQQILSYLDVQHLVSLFRVCRDLKIHAEEDRLWIDLLKPHIPHYDFHNSPHPAPSFCNLYLTHHPYWFLPRHKIWFSDDAYNGKLILIKFDAQKGSIEGYQLTAERPRAHAEAWSYKPSVIIHHINPRVYASTEDPVLSLPYSTKPHHRGTSAWIRSNGGSSEGQFGAWSLSNEPHMLVGRANQKINASLLLSRNLPLPTSNALSVSVWPPRTIPDMPRVRSSNSSSDKFASRGHRPNTLEEISQTTFRLRTWSHFMQGMAALGVRIGEEVSTWSTLSEDLYKPTKEKPYQGIFVGDYASHGCEFLLVLQTEQAPDRRARTVPNQDQEDTERDRPSNYIRAVLAALRDELVSEDELEEMADQGHMTVDVKGAVHVQAPRVEPNVSDGNGDYVVHKGAIEAIKLTGDVNVPRGEHTFIADDIGPAGTIRIAHERPFRGARVVRSRGHVAARGFRNGEYQYSGFLVVVIETEIG